MQNWQPATRTEWYRLAAAAAALAIIGAGALVGATATADAQTDIRLDGLDIAGVNQTTNGDVSAVGLSADVGYRHDVPDATRRVVTLKVGTSNNTLETLDYRNTRDPTGADSGSVTLSGDVLDATDLTAADVTPATASSATTELIVVADLRIERANGQAIERTVRDTVTVRLHDGTDLSASVGGAGVVTVETASA